MTNFQKLIGISALIISATIAYYFVIYLPKKHSEDVAIEINLKNQTLQLRTSCLESAYNTYVSDWNTACQTRGLSDRCSLFESVSKNINKRYNDLQDNCFKLYPSN